MLTLLLEHPSVHFCISPSFCEAESLCIECVPDYTEEEIINFRQDDLLGEAQSQNVCVLLLCYRHVK